ncbi:sugar phosphate nucleotidyltransferase, partial [uncultured Helicobacter sp.]|uniref:nucleotidyltransferase family protein n=1 Tax=uncultured Helicobacter sp. TaxID=175537 RepID=UPI002631DF62
QTYKNWKRFQYIPIVDNEGMLLGYKENHEIYNYSNKVIIMAGGLGTRLRPLTYDTPKPMLKLAGKPILQEIIESFKLKGFNNFLISVNYKAEVIKNYFHEGRDFGVKIHYLEEEERLGTCGSIKLAQTFINEPFFVINGDILASIDYEQLLIRHKEEKNDITICTFPYHYTVPYGVIEINHSTINITEKPTYTHQINCGIYLINPSLLTLIQEHTYLDMPNLIQEAILKQFKVGTFMIDEWIDIGNLDDFYKARDRVNHTKE